MIMLPNSLGGVAFLVAVCSALIAWLLCRIQPIILRWIGAVVAPFAVSYCIYWLPVWRGANPSQYYSWELLGIGIPFAAGLITSLLVIIILGRRQAN